MLSVVLYELKRSYFAFAKTRFARANSHFMVVHGVGFEPTHLCGTTTFKLLFSLHILDRLAGNRFSTRNAEGVDCRNRLIRARTKLGLGLSLTIVKAKLRLEGLEEHSEGIALVDTGASVTLVDREVADKVGVTPVKRTFTLATASGHKMEGELAVISKLIIEGEELPYAHLLLLEIPEEVKEMLRSKQLSDWAIIGLTTLELLNLVPDTTTRKLKKAESFMLI